MWIVQLCVVLLASAMCGALAERVGQSRVIGEISAGLILGPLLLGGSGGEYHGALFPKSAWTIMTTLGELGLVLLMFELGLHLDWNIFKERARIRIPIFVSLSSIVLPFAMGAAIAAMSYDVFAAGVPRLGYMLFCGLALSITALPVMARIADDLKLRNDPAATIALSAAALTDVLGWLVLALIAATLSNKYGWTEILINLGLLLLFTFASLRLIRPLWLRLFSRAGIANNASSLLISVFCYVLISSWATAQMGFHGAFGALVAGMTLRNVPQLSRVWQLHVEGFVKLVLMPVFFAHAGIQASLGNIPPTSFWPWFFLFLFGAIAGKFGGSYLGARLSGVKHHEACMIGALMNTRGLMELLVLTIGLQMNILPKPVYTMLVIMALVTTAMTVPLLNFFSPAIKKLSSTGESFGSAVQRKH